MSIDPRVEKIMALADEYAEAVHKRDRNGDGDAAQIADAKRATLRAAITEALDLGEPVARAMQSTRDIKPAWDATDFVDPWLATGAAVVVPLYASKDRT